MTPREGVGVWVKKFKAADADGVAELYHSNAVKHQVAQQPVEGRETIWTKFAEVFGRPPMVRIVEAIHEAGDVIALEWRNALSLRGYGFFTVHDGRFAFQRESGTSHPFRSCMGCPVE
ncbi:nuclear transport factor 2 family protein [Sabulicella glaciei]|uniref:Nuclear transport factor 2 family protein n=1 Tax=Sabulicella glaciei TaxID=2984948 RepID=A0ABT3NS88_9PROT|nr:nuclear transport factor 2 family protein [Roseococcus sp. MDT2-1-1]MCW8085027.1 nuclear transport factor 2 family protein [Roseococcus sp. MDT2-1-1]